ncbi:nickel ABC transporter substrate-binding protein [Bacillus australimaris]|uniref:Nickel ABC transporter substrate-binding protein n=1 Tax=Bacillus australimaris TaxID=1326968 RepID=A0ABD4QH69_9BACI|nr:nickel ABC transporter substrate-binding protein [Bacillus australimaris]KPN14633.1 nickel ABC transporter substrate-binding protein [Bacillus australimaris]MBR8689789.1 nickel ABC transporter substrate-binding protein [Bacillus australimaris]
MAIWNNFPKIKINTVLPFLLILFLLVGCSQTNNGADGNKDHPDMITMAWPRDIGEMNPHVYNPSQLFAQSMIYEPLVSYQKNGKLKPELAKSWDVSKDGKVYTFHLRDNVTFSDGSDFNANIVKKNFDSILKHKDIHSWLGVIKKIKKTEAVDKKTFKLTLTEPYYPTVQELAVVRPVRFLGEAGFPKNGDTSKGIEKPVGTGPWVLKTYKKDDYAIFERNDHYWGEKPKVKEIKVKVIPDAETRVMAFEKGDVDLLYGEGTISLDSYKQLEASGKYETKMSEPVATRQLVMNTKVDQLSDEKVRHALQYAFNKKSMVEGVTSGLEDEADHILPTNMPYTSDIQVKSFQYDVDKAKALLDEAGWTLPKGKTVREKDGKKLEFSMMYDSAESIQKAMAETLQAEWAAVGVGVKLEGVDLATQVQRFKANKFDMNFFSNYGAPYDPHTFMNVLSSDGFGFKEAISAYPNKDKLIKEMTEIPSTTNENKRKALYASVLSSLQDQGAIVPISYFKKTAVYQKAVKDFTFPANRDEHPFTGITLK